MSTNRSFDTHDDERYTQYLTQFDPLESDRQARRKRKVKADHRPKKTQQEILVEMVGEDFSLDLDGSFNVSYKPSRYEEGWLLNSLRSYFEQELMSDILAVVKGGKEATVYRCAPGMTLPDEEFVAAKVYRPRQFRNLSNDQMYQEGRALLTNKGRIIKNSDHRVMRAVGKKSAFGQQVEHTSWLTYEYKTLQSLYAMGAFVPKPFEMNENSILMKYYGDAYEAAPTLNRLGLGRGEAKLLFEEVIWNIELMLRHHLIHGDLSAYNILYWEGKVVLIDFPQVVNSHQNPQAEFILRRDVERVCDYFARFGVKTRTQDLADRLWQNYVAESPENILADHWIEPVDDDDED